MAFSRLDSDRHFYSRHDLTGVVRAPKLQRQQAPSRRGRQMTSLELTANSDAADSNERLTQWTRVLCVLFFFSGFPALIYQLTWQRALFRILGVNIESVTIVVTAVMLGLGLGSLAGGWLSKRCGIPALPLLAAIELVTGVFGSLSLAISDRVGQLALGPSLTIVRLRLARQRLCSPPIAFREPRCLLSFTPFQSSYWECRLKRLRRLPKDLETGIIS
jgi:hypothetical protein